MNKVLNSHKYLFLKIIFIIFKRNKSIKTVAKKEQDILEIQGVWTLEEVKSIKEWIQGAEGTKELEDQKALSKEQSKKILEIAHVDLEKLKTPFTFNL